MATIRCKPSRNLVYVDLIVNERSGSADPGTNTSIVDWSVVIRRGTATWDTSWSGWGQKIYANIDFPGYTDSSGNPVSQVIYIPEYNYDGRHKPGSTFASGSFTVTHESDGKKSVYCGISFTDKANGKSQTSGNYYTPGNGTAVYDYVELSQIPRYATASQTLNNYDETSVSMFWSSDSVCDYIWYSVNGGATWSNAIYVNNTYGSYTISGLTPENNYSIRTKVRRKDSQLTTETTNIPIKTYNYPCLSYIPSFTVGKTLKIDLYNPKNRRCHIYFIDNENVETYAGYTDNASFSGFTGTTPAGTSWLTILYNSLTRSYKGNFKIRMTCDTGSVDQTSVNVEYYLDMSDTGFIPTFDQSYITTIKNTSHTDISGQNKFIKGYNNLTFVIRPMVTKRNAVPDYYAVSASGLQSQTPSYSSSNITVDFGNMISNTFSVTAYDKRGFNKSATVAIDLVDYNKPQVSTYTITRQNGVGTKAILDFTGTYTNWSGLLKTNKIKTIKYRSKDSSVPSWSGISFTNLPSSATITSSNGIWTLYVLLNDTYSTTSRYDIQLQITDELDKTETISYSLSTAEALIWRDLQYKRVGIGKKPYSTLDVNGSISGDTINNVKFGGVIIGNATSFTKSFCQDIFGDEAAGYKLKEVRTQGIAPAPLCGDHSAGLAFKGSDTFGSLSMSYHSPQIKFAGGNGTDPNWYISLTGSSGEEYNLHNMLTKTNFLNTIYPVGSIYLSIDGTSPASKFGGSWSQISGGYLLPWGDSAGTSGGDWYTNYEGLEVRHLPPHSHTTSWKFSGGYNSAYAINWTNGLWQGPYQDALGAFSMNNTGSGDGHRHHYTPPFYKVYAWRRTA